MIKTAILSLILSCYLERPTLTIAQGMVESNLNPHAVGKMKEKGAWQVREKHWGKVPKRLIDQAQQSERILNELISESNGNIPVAVRKYNGSGKQARKYLAKVTKRAIELEVIGV